MAIARYFAMTAAEISLNPVLPPKIAWMACHFSPYGDGLSNLPEALPPDSLLILNDRTPIHGHDPQRIAGQLSGVLEALDCRGLLLDFQRPGVEETAALTRHLVQTLPRTVAVSDLYARELDCPVFLPPVPADTPLSGYLPPWKDREIWLELALDGEEITLTPEGAASGPLPLGPPTPEGTPEERLHCRYTVTVSENAARFTLWRTEQDLEALLEEAASLGVTTAVGLYQEFKPSLSPAPPKKDHNMPEPQMRD